MISDVKLTICMSESICVYVVLAAVRVYKIGNSEHNIVHICMDQRCGPLILKHPCVGLDLVILNI